MGLARRLLEGAVNRMDALGDRMTEADLARLTPEQREQYERWEAHAAAHRAGVPAEEIPDPRLATTVVGAGPGAAAGGVLPGTGGRGEPREAIEDPAAWAAQRDLERVARDRAREPYLAPGRHPVRITRVATRGKTQLREVADHLAASGLAARPDLVYGAARVPDFISPGRIGSEKGRVVEWDIVHASDGTLPPCTPPAVVTLDAGEQWVARAVGEPSPLDEDVALDLLARAGVGPEATLGIARELVVEKESGSEDEGSSAIRAEVRGVHVLVPAEEGDAVRAAASAPRPWELGEGPPDGVVVEVLQWEAIAAVVQPRRQHRPVMPSPHPHLPVTPQELLRAYLEVVGIAPSDCCAAQVTHDRWFDLLTRTSTRAGVRRTGGGPDLPCADGKARKRMSGGHHVVVAYRDRPEYAEGRTRFDEYASTVMGAHLRRGLGIRWPVPRPPNRLERTAERVAAVHAFFTFDSATSEEERPRYCWPPAR